MKIGDVIVVLVNSVLIGWIGYKVIGLIIPIAVVGSYLVGWIANHYRDKKRL